MTTGHVELAKGFYKGVLSRLASIANVYDRNEFYHQAIGILGTAKSAMMWWPDTEDTTYFYNQLSRMEEMLFNWYWG